jgi:prepilin-type N-terminal cleavage/methylation domain-containing protein
MELSSKQSSKKSFGLQKGFTLIELLVVIAIIGLLSSIVLSSLNTARSKSRDVSRLDTLREIRTALENYRNDVGHYPDTNNIWTCFDCTNSAYSTTNTIIVDAVNTTAVSISTALVSKKYLASKPVDLKPISVGDDGYVYITPVGGGDYCLMSFKNPENMNDFKSATINQYRCPTIVNGQCTGIGNVNSIYFTSNPSAYPVGC